ncbi:hypothetical protein ACWD0A_15685 [Streptomyces sp. NPDC002867]
MPAARGSRRNRVAVPELRAYEIDGRLLPGLRSRFTGLRLHEVLVRRL